MFNRSYIDVHKGHPHYITDFRFLFLQKKLKLSNKEEGFLRIIRNLSDPTKLKIYLLLHKAKEIPVTDIAQILGLNQSTVSHALSDLKNLGIINEKRCGQCICYFLNKEKHSSSFRKFLNKITYD